MAEIPYDVADAFLAGKPARRGEFRSTGQLLTSYDMWLASLEEDGTVVFHYVPLHEGGVQVSKTTNRHCRALESRVFGSAHPIRIEPRALPYGVPLSYGKRGRSSCPMGQRP